MGSGAGDPGKNIEIGEAAELEDGIEDSWCCVKFWVGPQGGRAQLFRLSAGEGEVRCRLGCWT